MPQRAAARVSVLIEQQDSRVKLTYADDGPGFPEQVLRGEKIRIGFDLIGSIVRANFQGELKLRNDGGARVEIVFDPRLQERE